MNQLRVTGEVDGGADGGMQKSRGHAGRVFAPPSHSLEGDPAIVSVRTSTPAPEHLPLSTGTDQAAVLKLLGAAFLTGLGRKADVGSEDRVRLGLCADPQEQSSAQILPLVLLAKKLSTEQERSRLHILHPAKGNHLYRFSLIPAFFFSFPVSQGSGVTLQLFKV